MTARMDHWTARLTINHWRNTHPRAATAHWHRFDWLNMAAHELRRALLGIDGPNAWCGGRNARIRRIVAHAATFDRPRLP